MSRLTANSRSFVDALFATYPRWIPTAHVDADGALVLEVTSPLGDTLSVDTADNEITVGFSLWHMHFYFEDAADALQLIADLLEEKLAVAVAMRGEEWMDSTILPTDDEDAWLEFVTAPRQADLYYQRSWRGTFNRLLRL